MDTTTFGGVILVEGNGSGGGKGGDSGGSVGESHPKKDVYIYECIKNDDYAPENDEPFRSSPGFTTEDKSSCHRCKMSFKDFRGEVDIRDQGEVVWARRWNGHRIHCKGGNFGGSETLEKQFNLK